MRREPKNYITSTLIARKPKINPKPQYQRTAVWNIGKKQRLIDTILREFDIPKLYLAASSDPHFDHEVVDGQQRLRAIWEFFEDNFPLGDVSKDLEIGDLSGKTYSELPNNAKDLFDLYELNIIILQDVEESEIRDQFLITRRCLLKSCREKKCNGR